MEFQIRTYGRADAPVILVQMVDDHDMEGMEREIGHILALTGNRDFFLAAVRVNSWNHDLSPWTAPAVFGNEDFGGGAPGTLQALLEEVLPGLTGTDTEPGKKMYIGGYSLAGLFALWAGCRTDLFDGVAAASPSAWFPHFTEYMQENPMLARSVYLSLGDKEERTRNPVMSRVAGAIRQVHGLLEAQGKDCILEWNAGNHFREPDLRTAKAFAWLMSGGGRGART